MAVLFCSIILFSLYQLSSTYPLLDRKLQADYILKSEMVINVRLISGYSNIQLVALLGFFLILVLGVFISLRQTIRRMFFWKKKPCEDLDYNNSKFKPVVCIHGLLDSASALSFFADVIRENHLGTLVKVIDAYNGLNSLAPMWKQIENIKEIVESICAEHPEGINLVGLSQGALLARGVLETSDKHNVDTFVSIAGPQMGQFGIPLVHWLPGYKYIIKNVFRCAYTSCLQKLSVPEYWKDPYQSSLYEETNNFLPILNNEKNHPDNERFKSNFTRLRHIVLIGSPDDGFISPWQSSHFGYYDDQGNIVEMKDQNVYKNDLFGLRTLDEKKAITVYSIPNVAHYFYVYNEPLIIEYILPHLN